MRAADGSGDAAGTQTLASFLWPYLRRRLGWVAVAFVLMGIFGLCTAAVVGLMPRVFDDVLLTSGADRSATASAPSLPQASSGAHRFLGDLYSGLQNRLGVKEENRFWSPLVFAPVLWVFVFLIRGTAVALSTLTFQRIGFGATTAVREDLYRALISQSVRFHSAWPSGELASRVLNDVAKLQTILSEKLLDLVQQSVALVVLLAAIFVINARLAAIAVIGAPLLLIPIVRFGRRMRSTSSAGQARMGDLSRLLIEGLKGHRVAKAYGMEQFEGDRFAAAGRRLLGATLRARSVAAFSSPVVEALAAVGGASLAVYCGLLIRNGAMTPSLVLTFLTTLFMIYEPVRKLNRVHLVGQEAAASALRVTELLASSNDIRESAEPQRLERIREGVRLREVSLRLGDKLVLDRVDLEIATGEIVALVGPSGGGKTTLANLLLRFYDPDHGRVEVDGIDLRHLALEDLRRLTAVVLQETFLFDESVRDCIAYGKPETSLEKIREAAAAAYADDFVMALPDGYDTKIGEGGCRLSGGQRQRLAIARAILRDPQLLILDEATSNLDGKAEKVVHRALRNLMRGRTALVIAHRLSTVTEANRIVFVENGRIVEQGTHAELARKETTAYRRLFDLQLLPGSGDSVAEV